jgi:hypothetical protein
LQLLPNTNQRPHTAESHLCQFCDTRNGTSRMLPQQDITQNSLTWKTTVHSQEKKLNNLIGSEEIDDETIHRWNDTCLSRLRTQLVRQAFQLPTIMELIKMITTRIVNGKEVPIYTQRDKHMRPPVDVYRVTLTPALIQA